MHAHAQPAPPDEMMGRMDDDALWQALRAADEQAFRMLFQRHSRAVYNVAFRHASSWAAAEEATQACFSGIWRRAAAGTLPEVAHGVVRAWLCAVGRNEARNLVRSDGRRLRLVGRVAQQPREDRHDNVEDWVAHEESMRRINQVLARIPDGQRIVVELVAWGGLTMDEVAAALDLPTGTVKSRLSRARKALATSEVAHLLGKENPT